jgi:hypothetical protein
MEHLYYVQYVKYSAKIWALAGRVLTLALSWHTGEYIPANILMQLEKVSNKPRPSGFLFISNTIMHGKL